jgi:hypothetical protein
MCQTQETRLVSYPARGLTAVRPTHYRSAPDPTDPSPLGLAIRRLFCPPCGYSHSEIVELLRELSPGAILALEADALWNRNAIEASLEPASGTDLTLRQVKYYCARMGLFRKPGSRLNKKRKTPLPDLLREHHAHVARDMGWGHCLPLTPGEAKVLDSLYELGPSSRKVIEVHAGVVLDQSRTSRKAFARVRVNGVVVEVRRLPPPARTPLQRLIERGLVVIVHPWPAPLYALAPGLGRRNMARKVERQEAFLQAVGG